jgi:large subunit ribosomal protein L10
MNKAEKVEFIDDLKASLASAKGLFAADFRGLTVAEVTSLRFELKKAKSDLKVVKNRLALRAMENMDAPEFKKHFDYMTAVVISHGDVAQGAKAVTKFAKDNTKFKLKAGYVEGKVINLADIKALSTLPSREELLAKLLGTLMAVPTGFVRVLNGVPSKWVYLIDAIRRQKEEKGG